MFPNDEETLIYSLKNKLYGMISFSPKSFLPSLKALHFRCFCFQLSVWYFFPFSLSSQAVISIKVYLKIKPLKSISQNIRKFLKHFSNFRLHPILIIYPDCKLPIAEYQYWMLLTRQHTHTHNTGRTTGSNKFTNNQHTYM